MKAIFIKILSVALLGGVLIFAGACKKKKQEPIPIGAVVTKGCTDKDSPYFDANAEESDGTCKYLRVTKYEITYHPEKDGTSNWDPVVYTKADLILKIKVQGASNWLFQSTTKEDQPHNVPAEWVSPSPLKLLNKNYEWLLEDDDNGTANDFISSGIFNPITTADLNSNSITSVSNGSQMKIYFNIQ